MSTPADRLRALIEADRLSASEGFDLERVLERLEGLEDAVSEIIAAHEADDAIMLSKLVADMVTRFAGSVRQRA